MLTSFSIHMIMIESMVDIDSIKNIHKLIMDIFFSETFL